MSLENCFRAERKEMNDVKINITLDPLKNGLVMQDHGKKVPLEKDLHYPIIGSSLCCNTTKYCFPALTNSKRHHRNDITCLFIPIICKKGELHH